MKVTMVLCQALLVAAPLLTAGCSSGRKERITMLEQNNRKLTEQLNGAHRALGDVRRDRDGLRRQLSGQTGEADHLRLLLAEVEAREAAAPVGWTPVAGGGMISIQGNLLFAPGKTKVRSDARGTLDGILSTLRGEYSDKDVLVIGHTDDQPIRRSGWSDNWQLSTERSLAVVRYLQQGGVETHRLLACGAGEHRPRVAGSKAERAANRRVEIYAVDPGLLRNK